MFKTIRKLGKNYKKKENTFPGRGSNPRPLACQSSALTTVPTKHLFRGMLNSVIFILLYIASFVHITKTGEFGNLKPTWFNILLGALSSDISPKPSTAQQAKIGLYPIL